VFTHHPRLRLVALFAAVLGCCFLGGCGSSDRNRGFVSGNTPQGQVLARMLQENRQLEPTTDLPIQLSPIKIDVHHNDKGREYRPVLIWRAPQVAALQAALRKRIRARQPSLGQGRALEVQARLVYHNDDDEECGQDEVVLNLANVQGTLVLKNLGTRGEPSRADLELRSVSWQEAESVLSTGLGPSGKTLVKAAGSVPLERPANLPIRLELVWINNGNGEAEQTEAVRLKWWLVGGHAALHKVLRDKGTSQGKSLGDRTATRLVLLLEYTDQHNQALGSEHVAMDLQEDEGTIELKKLVKPTPPLTVVLAVRCVTWPERVVQVPLHD
jgi:hypothetical protein